MRMKTLSMLAAILAAATGARASVLSFDIVPVNNSSVASLDPYTTQDLTIDFTGIWTGSQLLINLTAGSIYQDGAGSATPPSNLFVGFVPSLAFDTYLGAGSIRSDAPAVIPNVGGAAVDLQPGLRPAVFTTALIDQAWNPPGGANLTGLSDFFTARITLSDNAEGTFKYLASADGQISKFDGTIAGGQLSVPEPASLGLLAMLGLTVLKRRRKD